MNLAKQTLRSEEGKKVLDYLKDKRGFSDQVIDEFDIGYCPDRVNHEVSGKIIIPIRDTYGEIIALSTRHPDKDNPHRFWHESFDKRTSLFALHKAKSAILRVGKAIVVEGEFDVGAYHSVGLDMTVGACGSNLTLYQISLLLRYCSEIYLMFDPDEAGELAISRTMTEYEKNGINNFGVSFIPVNLPSKNDPDDFLFRVGKTGVISKLKESKEQWLKIKE